MFRKATDTKSSFQGQSWLATKSTSALTWGLLLLLISAASISSAAESPQQSPQQSTDSDFDRAAPTYDTAQRRKTATVEDRLAQIEETIRWQCDSEKRCWLVGIGCSGEGWTFALTGGVGSRSNATGTTVINLNQDGTPTSNEPYYGASLTYKNQKSRTDIFVSPAQKRLFETADTFSLNPDGTMKRDYTNQEHSLRSLYITILQKLDSCRQSLN